MGVLAVQFKAQSHYPIIEKKDIKVDYQYFLILNHLAIC